MATLVLTFSLLVPSHSSYAETDILNMVKQQLTQAGVQVESIEISGHSNYLTTYDNKSMPVETLTVQIKEHATFEDMLKGSETIEQYLLYLALDNGLTIEESQKLYTPLDILAWLKSHNIDITKGYTWTWGMDVAVIDNQLMIVFEDGTIQPLDTFLARKPNKQLAEKNKQLLEALTNGN